jgi:hypothetical protein
MFVDITTLNMVSANQCNQKEGIPIHFSGKKSTCMQKQTILALNKLPGLDNVILIPLKDATSYIVNLPKTELQNILSKKGAFILKPTNIPHNIKISNPGIFIGSPFYYVLQKTTNGGTKKRNKKRRIKTQKNNSALTFH